ncbi:DUF3265 domain-containing protein [Aeromonas caviae]|nr:DUF3265 domain-containing protein [Aeromonas caviae]
MFIFIEKKPNNFLKWICNAWHFHYVSRLVFKVICSGFSISLLIS